MTAYKCLYNIEFKTFPVYSSGEFLHPVNNIGFFYTIPKVVFEVHSKFSTSPCNGTNGKLFYLFFIRVTLLNFLYQIHFTFATGVSKMLGCKYSNFTPGAVTARDGPESLSIEQTPTNFQHLAISLSLHEFTYYSGPQN